MGEGGGACWARSHLWQSRAAATMRRVPYLHPACCWYQHKSSIRLLLMVHAVRCEMVTCGMVLLPRAGGWEQCDGLKRT